MKKRVLHFLSVLFLINLFFASAVMATTLCTLKFHFKQRTNIFKTGKGEGTIACDNGGKADVTLKVYGGWIGLGGGVSVSDSATFSPVTDVSKLFGIYYVPGGDAGTSGGPVAIPVISKEDIVLRFANPGDGQALGLAPGAGLKLIKKK